MQAAEYLPVGVQNNVSVGTVTGGGWTQCFVQGYGTYGPSLTSILDGCSGDRLMLAGRVAGSDTLMVLAQAAFDDVIFDTGVGYTATHNANGVEWYFDEDWSWGFAQGGSAVYRNSCDVASSMAAQRLCWHTDSGNLSGGWRLGAITSAYSSGYEKVIYSFSGSGGAVPEPATWLMMILGFGAIGSAMRGQKRRESVTVRYA